MNRQWLRVTIIFALTLGTLFFWEMPPSEWLGKKSDDAPKIDRKKVPTQIVIGHKSKHFNIEGTLSHQVETTRLNHFQLHPKRQTANDFTEFENPSLVMYREDDAPWHVKSDAGTSTKAGKIITLTKNVHIWQDAPASGRTELTTQKLVIRPEEQFAETNAAVKIVDPSTTITAVGMQADMKKDIIKLLKKVKSTYYEAP